MTYAISIHLCACKKCNTTWLQRSPFLTKDFTIKSCDESLNLVPKCVEYRLGPAILERTKMNTNTQKVEATNRSMRRSLPKHLTLRNFPGRVHSAAYNINIGLANQYTNCVRLLALQSLLEQGFLGPYTKNKRKQTVINLAKRQNIT